MPKVRMYLLCTQMFRKEKIWKEKRKIQYSMHNIYIITQTIPFMFSFVYLFAKHLL